MISNHARRGKKPRTVVVDGYRITFDSPAKNLQRKLRGSLSNLSPSGESSGSKCPACEDGNLSFSDQYHYADVACSRRCRRAVILACGDSTDLRDLVAAPLRDSVSEIEFAISMYRGEQAVWYPNLNSDELTFEFIKLLTFAEILQLRHKFAQTRWNGPHSFENAKLFDWQEILKSLRTLRSTNGAYQWAS